MIPLDCPGSQKFKKPYPETIKCVFCQQEIEIWSDETAAECPKCKKMISREGAQCCLDWCKYAKECIGEEKYNKYIENKRRGGS